MITAIIICFVGSWAVQVLAWTWMGRAAQMQVSADKQQAQSPMVSVVVCARNEAERLRRYLPLLLEQTYTPYEVVVVDDDSQDETAAVLAALQAAYPRLRSLRLHPKRGLGKKAALTAGIAAAQGEWLLLTDADCAPASRQWVAEMTAVATGRPEIAIVLGYSPYRTGRTWLGRWIRWETIYTAIQYLSAARQGLPYMGVGRNLMYRKSLFEQVGGMSGHAHLPSGDDDLLVNRAANATNTDVCLSPTTYMWSEPKTDWRTWWQQKRRHLSVGTAYRREHQWLLGAVALSHSLFYVLLPLLLWLVSNYWALWAAGALTRRLVWGWGWGRWLKKLNEKKFLLTACFLDIFVPLYYLVVTFALRQPQIKKW